MDNLLCLSCSLSSLNSTKVKPQIIFEFQNYYKVRFSSISVKFYSVQSIISPKKSDPSVLVVIKRYQPEEPANHRRNLIGRGIEPVLFDCLFAILTQFRSAQNNSRLHLLGIESKVAIVYLRWLLLGK